MDNLFDKISDYYDLVYEDKDSEGEVDYIISLLKSTVIMGIQSWNMVVGLEDMGEFLQIRVIKFMV